MNYFHALVGTGEYGCECGCIGTWVEVYDEPTHEEHYTAFVFETWDPTKESKEDFAYRQVLEFVEGHRKLDYLTELMPNLRDKIENTVYDPY